MKAAKLRNFCGQSAQFAWSDGVFSFHLRNHSFQSSGIPVSYMPDSADAEVGILKEHRVISKACLIAIGINNQGHKEVLGFDVCSSERENNWKEFFSGLKARGLHGVDIVISDNHSGLVSAVKDSFSGVSWQRCQVHFLRNIIDKTPKRYQTGLAQELRSMFNCSTIEEARRLKKEIMEEYEGVASEAMATLDEGFEDSMMVMALPTKYRIPIRTSNLIERENREIRRRENAIGIFPNTESAIRLIGAILMDDHYDWSLQMRLFSMTEYYENLATIKLKLQTGACEKKSVKR